MMLKKYSALGLILLVVLVQLWGCGRGKPFPTKIGKTTTTTTSTSTTTSTVTTTTTSSTTTTAPGTRWITFSGLRWEVKDSGGATTGPQNNYFSDSTDNVWVDGSGQLHLKITQRGGKWYCAEVISEDSFGYGKYNFYAASRVDQLNENVVCGLFTWSNDPAYHNREIDIEFSLWGGGVGAINTQYTVQPYTTAGNCHSLTMALAGNYSAHQFHWTSGQVAFKSVQGEDLNTDTIEAWTYTGADNPLPGDENVRLNLWLMNGLAPTDSQEAEVVVKRFEFVP